MACINHHFLFQVTNSSMESVDTGKFIDLYHLSAEKAEVDLTSGTEPKPQSLLCAYSDFYPSIGSHPSILISVRQMT